ncbi:hypothetical protein [Actinomycetospora chiangmaiensis]|uniref:hypothetical protein n=1 Tax=Actinomycetospora chiangmaiensis TaxID=402650 RepID=UPI0012F807E3|nr:hypothetical protein [Actinomycetospora chiangmaiensis]
MRKAVLASALISSGLVSTAGLAMAHESGADTVQRGLVNSSDFAPNTPVNVCNNDVPVNVLGVQVPVQDNAVAVPVASKAKDGNGAAIAKSCHAPVHAVN